MAGDSTLSSSHNTSLRTRLPEIRVVLLGDGSVGKTSLLRQYLDHEGLSSSTGGYEPTLLDSYTHIEYCGAQPYRVHITDCSSAPEFREHRAAYLAKCDLVILVFSALHPKSLENLRSWMKEVVEARTSTGPARFTSTVGDYSEVPIFVVGTHYGEKQTSVAQKPVPLAEAESVTAECLHSAGYFIDEEDADTEEELRQQRAATTKEQKCVRERRPSNAFRYFFPDLFKSSGVGDDNRHGKSNKSKNNEKSSNRRKKEEEAKNQPQRSPHSRSLSQLHTPHTSSTGKLQGSPELSGDGAASWDSNALAVLPPGASARLPLYMLSNKDGEAVNTAVRASLALHLWLKSIAYSAEVSPGVTPPLSPRARNSTLSTVEKPASASGTGPATSTQMGETATGLTSRHGRSVSAASHSSHVSERSAASFIPTMPALYGSVTSLSAFETSFHHSSVTSPCPLTEGNSPFVPGYSTQILVAVGEATPPSTSPPGLDGKRATEPYSSFSANAPRNKGPLEGSVWYSPTSITPSRIEDLGVEATPNLKKFSERCPAALKATLSNVTPLHDGQLLQTNTDIFVASPPSPRLATAPRTPFKTGIAVHSADLSRSPPCDDYSAPSGKDAGGSANPLPWWAAAATPARCGSRSKADGIAECPSRIWKDVDAEPNLNDTAKHQEPAKMAESVVKKLALEQEGNSGAASATTSQVKSNVVPPASESPGPPSGTSAPLAAHRDSRAFAASSSSISTLCSSIASPPSFELGCTHSRLPSHAHSRSQSYASAPLLQGASCSQTRALVHEESILERNSPCSASNQLSRALTKSATPVKQKATQCTTDGCIIM